MGGLSSAADAPGLVGSRLGRFGLVERGSRRRTSVYLRDVLALVAAYYAAAHLGYAFGFSGAVAAIVWLPVGVGISFLYLRGLRLWPGVVLGDLLVNNYTALPIGSALGQSVGNLLEVVVATILLRRLCPRGDPSSTIRGVGGMLVAIAAGTAISATIGSLSALVGHVIGAGQLPSVWRTWWLGDVCGALILVPLALSWSQPLPRRWPRERLVEATLTLAAVVGLSAATLLSTQTTRSLAMPALIWAALRFGPRGATLAGALICGFAIWGATHVAGAFGLGSIDQRLLETQLFIAVVWVSGLSIAALSSETAELGDQLKASRRRIVAASDEARRRLERNLHDGAQQRLVSLAVRLGVESERVRVSDAEAAQKLAAARQEVVGVIDDLRDFAQGIHPTVLRRYGLAEAIRAIARRASVPIELRALPSERLDQLSEATAYYTVLEAITNAEKHARPSVLEVRVARTGRALLVEVSDDGVGGAVERDGGGLQGLRDRVEAAGGSLAVDSQAGRGTRLTARLPAGIVEPSDP